CLHIAVAFATLGAVISGELAHHLNTQFTRGLFAACVAVIVACVLAVCVPSMVDRDRAVPWSERVAQALRIVAILLVVTVVAVAMLPRGNWATPGSLPGDGTVVTLLFAAQSALLVVLALIVVGQRKVKRRYLFGLGTPIVAAFSLAMAAAFTAGLSFRAADFLDNSANPTMAVTPGASADHRIA